MFTARYKEAWSCLRIQDSLEWQSGCFSLSSVPPASPTPQTPPKATDAPNYADSTVVQGILQGLEAADDPQQAFSQLAPAAQQAVIDFLKVASISSEQESVSQPNLMQSQFCDAHSRKRIAYNVLGNKLWTYQSDTSWCWDGTQITNDPSFDVSGQVHWLLWEFVGHVRTRETGGQGDWVHSDYGQGHFRLCLGSDNCIKHNYPWIRKYQYADGGKDWDHD